MWAKKKKTLRAGGPRATGAQEPPKSAGPSPRSQKKKDHPWYGFFPHKVMWAWTPADLYRGGAKSGGQNGQDLLKR